MSGCTLFHTIIILKQNTDKIYVPREISLVFVGSENLYDNPLTEFMKKKKKSKKENPLANTYNAKRE